MAKNMAQEVACELNCLYIWELRNPLSPYCCYNTDDASLMSVEWFVVWSCTLGGYKGAKSNLSS